MTHIARLIATIVLALLTACGEPVRLNAGPGAVLPVTLVSDHTMAQSAGSEQLPLGTVVVGLYIADPGVGSILLLHGGESASTLAHELAHACDRNGWSFAEGVKAITPTDPSPALARRLVVLWEIQREGSDYWHSIYRRWGASAVGHARILARFQ